MRPSVAYSRLIYRRLRAEMTRRVLPHWSGTRAGLKQAVNRFLKPVRKRPGLLYRFLRGPGFAAVLAGAFLSASARPAYAIQLSDIVATEEGGLISSGLLAGDFVGASVSEAGDVNGDGLADYIVGVPGASPYLRTDAGENFVIFGRRDGGRANLVDLFGGYGGFAMFGETAGDESGRSVSGAGDVNGDGLDDVIIGAPHASYYGNANAGRSYVVFGKADGTPVSLANVAAGMGGFFIGGAAEADQSGSSVSGAGDINGDGLADLIVGAPMADSGELSDNGRSYVIFGKADGVRVDLFNVPLNGGIGGFVINGASDGEHSGPSVSGAGDVNGDGLADVIVGAPDAQFYSPADGKSYVIFGKTDTDPVELSAVESGTGGFRIGGASAGEHSGTSVSGAGDVNGDGLADLIVGAPAAAPGGRTDAGRSYVVFGKANGFGIDLLYLNGNGFGINGGPEGDRSGTSVSSAGDVNGDGFADVIVGAPGSDANATGASFVVFGKPGAGGVDLSAVAAGTGGFGIFGFHAEDRVGDSVSSGGDVNGDGLSDVIVGADKADPSNRIDSGQSFAIFSPVAPAASGTYKMSTLAGDGPGGLVAPVTDFGDVARVKISFSDDDLGSGGGLNGASNETITITRSNADISGLPNAFPVYWQITSDRANFNSVEVTFKYLNSELSGPPGTRDILSIFVSASLGGTWTPVPTTRIPGRNELKATFGGGLGPAFFAIAPGIGLTPPVHLSDVAGGLGGFVINGIDADDYSGRSVSGAGDVNGDGLADLIVGARGADPGGDSGAGESYVVFGKKGGTAVELSEVAAGMGGFVINGIDVGDRSGASVSGAGDVNGDGLADLIVGAAYADPGGNDIAGESYVVFGKVDGTPVELSDVAAGNGGFIILGVDAGDNSGMSVSGAGDVNGDGLADLIVGAFFANPGGRSKAGESYVVFGKANGTAVNLSDVANGTGGFVINGIDANDYSGRTVSSAGDVNGDGLSDLIVGAFGAGPGGDTQAGESYVVFGRANGTAVELSDVAAGTGGFVINGIDPFDFSGLSISSAGDVNGDGLSDLVVGARAADPDGKSAAGESYVVFGKADGTAVELSDVAAGVGGFAIYGNHAGDGSGYSVSSAGDVNGDGLADLIVGAYGVDSFAGASYVIFGKADGTAVELSDVATGMGGFVITGIDAEDRSGYSVASAGDVNGDGLSDLIVGAAYADPDGRSKAGESYVVFSHVPAAPLGTYRRHTLAGDGPGGSFVAPVTDFGDVARAKIDFSDDDLGSGTGLNGASAETVTIKRANTGISGLPDALPVLWTVASDRSNFDWASITLKYLDSEVHGTSGTEAILSIYQAESPDGPWYEVPTQRSPGRNELKWVVGGFAFPYLAIAPGVGLTAPINLADVAGGTGGFVINGIDVDDFSGRSVASAGDVNGDGLADLIIGADGADPGGDSRAGESYVVFGKPGGTAVELSEVAAGVGGFVINGIDEEDYSGKTVASAGDVNGDGLADLIVAANGAANPAGPANAGESYVVFGKTDGSAVELSDVAMGTGGFAINGNHAGDFSGTSVASAGDVNGDGLADLIVGAQGALGTAGESYVVFGKQGGAAVELSDVAAGTGGFVIAGFKAAARSGRSVASAGDVNGDGLADLIVGAYLANIGGTTAAGESYVVFGKASGTAVGLSDVSTGTGGFVIHGIDATDLSGRSVASAGDVNGDGLADLIVGVHYADLDGRSEAGESYVVFGKPGGTAVELSDVAAGTGGFVINGIDGNDQSGGSVASAGDVNGDGLADLIVGADRAGVFTGESYVLFGKADGTAVELSDVTGGMGGFVINGIDVGDYSGGSVASAGDVNGDGLSDLIVGARNADPGGRSKAGESYVVFSHVPAAPSGTYRRHTIAGDGLGGFVRPVTDFGDVARAKLDFFPDDASSGGGLANSSSETVTITRSDMGVPNLVGAANVLWEISSDRTGFIPPSVTLKYLDSEVAGVPGGEAALRAFFAPLDSGPWLELNSTLYPERNAIELSTGAFGFFALAPVQPLTPQDIAVNRTELNFGLQAVDLGGIQTGDLHITNLGQTDLTFIGSQVAISGPDASQFTIIDDTMQSVLPQGPTRTITVVFDPSSEGSKTATLTITTDDPDEPSVEVALMGTGAPSGLTSSPSVVDLGARAAGAGPGASVAVTITNATGAIIALEPAVVISGSDFGEFSLTSDSGETSLDPGASRTLGVAFSPTIGGAKTARFGVKRVGAATSSVSAVVMGAGSAGQSATVPNQSIINYLLGISIDPSGKDVNGDGEVDAADLVKNINGFASSAPESPSPADAESGLALTPKFMWSDPGSHSGSFDFEIFNAGGFSMTLTGLTTNSVTLAQPLQPGTAYTWRVTSHTGGGATVGPNWTFTTAP